MDLHEYVMQAKSNEQIVVQPRLGVPDPREMASRLGALAKLRAPVVGTLTVDSYTRVGDLAGARDAWSRGDSLNGFPLAMHPPEIVRWVLGHAGTMPVQVRHGSADPRTVLRAARANGLDISEGGPVSYCLPYSRMPLAQAVEYWREGVQNFAEPIDALSRPHMETFGGCMLGQLCPPSLLIALSVLEAIFFEKCGIESLSLSYAEQGHWDQDIEALQSLRALAKQYLSPETATHIVQYSYMGVYPRTQRGALGLAAESARKARLGGAEQLIIKTVAKAHRLPTLSENISALEHASTAAATQKESAVKAETQVYAEAVMIIDSVLDVHEDIGRALVLSFERGLLDVPFCLHPDNANRARSTIAEDGRIVWSDTAGTALPKVRNAKALTSGKLMDALNRVAERFDNSTDQHSVLFVGCGPRNLSVLERLATRARTYRAEMPNLKILVVEPFEHGAGRIWRTNQPRELLMNTVCQEVTMFSGPRVSERDEPGAGRSLDEWWCEEHPESYCGGNAYAPRGLYGEYLAHVYEVCKASLQPRFEFEQISDSVDRLTKSGGVWTAMLRGGARLLTDTVVLGTGHPHARPIDNESANGANKENSRHGDSAADVSIEQILPGEEVALVGLGLSFYDLVARLTVGRGGEYVRLRDGSFKYKRSGKEPRILGLSRSGLPIPARGRNEKRAISSFEPLIFTQASVMGLPLTQAMHLLELEVSAEYMAHFVPDPRAFRAQISSHSADMTSTKLEHIAKGMGADGDSLPHLRHLARPFEGEIFSSVGEWEARVRQAILSDIDCAQEGNVSNALKSALDVIRDVRGILRTYIEESALTASERAEFEAIWAPTLSLISTGPPVDRSRELLALMDAGVVALAPPGTWLENDENGKLLLCADTLPGYRRHVDHSIDARVPKAVWPSDRVDLIGNMLAGGFVRLWRHVDGTGSFAPGGLDVTGDHRGVDANGSPDDSLLIVGIPTEGRRWFTQVGSGRPGPWGDFASRADSLAGAVITRAFMSYRSGRTGDPLVQLEVLG